MTLAFEPRFHSLTNGFEHENPFHVTITEFFGGNFLTAVYSEKFSSHHPLAFYRF